MEERYYRCWSRNCDASLVANRTNARADAFAMSLFALSNRTVDRPVPDLIYRTISFPPTVDQPCTPSVFVSSDYVRGVRTGNRRQSSQDVTWKASRRLIPRIASHDLDVEYEKPANGKRERKRELATWNTLNYSPTSASGDTYSYTRCRENTIHIYQLNLSSIFFFNQNFKMSGICQQVDDFSKRY